MMTPNLQELIFIDIETVSQHSNFDEISKEFKKIWQKKMRFESERSQLPEEELYQQKAAIFAEFGKIICISVGMWSQTEQILKIKSFSGNDEKLILTDFIEFCQKLKSKKYLFCGHNIKEFDIPYICRRMLIQDFKIPQILDFQNKKPWEVQMVDTLQFWKFGDYKHYVSLDTLTTIFNVPSPKEDIDGSMVGDAYWNQNNMAKIVAYCQRDVEAVAQLFLKLNQQPLLSPDKIKII
jgi:predicted PolB exonuclease-like 3'-5' exonuclease